MSINIKILMNSSKLNSHYCLFFSYNEIGSISNAHFTPTYPLSLYIHGKAGAGKSSFVRNFAPALNAAIEQHLDPSLLVRFVKQNLNKPFKDLELEFEIRPNNNDLSVMGIIQSRQNSLTQAKPGLVVCMRKSEILLSFIQLFVNSYVSYFFYFIGDWNGGDGK